MPVWNVDKWAQRLSKAHRRLALVTMQQHEGSSITVAWLSKPNGCCVFRQTFASHLISCFFTSEVINEAINLKIYCLSAALLRACEKWGKKMAALCNGTMWIKKRKPWEVILPTVKVLMCGCVFQCNQWSKHHGEIYSGWKSILIIFGQAHFKAGKHTFVIGFWTKLTLRKPVYWMSSLSAQTFLNVTAIYFGLM